MRTNQIDVLVPSRSFVWYTVDADNTAWKFNDENSSVLPFSFPPLFTQSPLGQGAEPRIHQNRRLNLNPVQ